MVKQLLSTTALVLALSAPAWAQTATDDAATTGQGQTQEMNAQGTDQTQGATGDTGAADTQSTDTQTEEPAGGTAESTPPAETPDTGTGTAGTGTEMPESSTGTAATDTEEPAADTDKVVIAEQKEGQMKAEDLMGLSVVSAKGEDIGEVQDLIFDQDEKITGVVVGVGGFLGIGQKQVALNWDQAEVQQDPDSGEEVIMVSMTKEELEAAPEFKTTEEQKAEDEAAQQQMQGGGTATAPAVPSTGGVQ